jgi:hypothetical protein
MIGRAPYRPGPVVQIPLIPKLNRAAALLGLTVFPASQAEALNNPMERD